MGYASEDERDPDPYYGLTLLSQTALTSPGGHIDLGGIVGARPGRGGSWAMPFTNRMEFDVGASLDPTLLRYDLWRTVLLLLAETWEATWVEAAPRHERALRHDPRLPGLLDVLPVAALCPAGDAAGRDRRRAPPQRRAVHATPEISEPPTHGTLPPPVPSRPRWSR